MQITEEEKLLEKRCCDQAALAQKTGKPRFSPFLDPRQAARLLPFFKKRGAAVLPFGGYDGAERQMLAFYTDSQPGKDEFPIGALEITGRDLDGLSHRDFLGSVLGLGFTREKVGDIVPDGGRCVVFLSRELCGFAEQNLDKVGRVGVSAKACEAGSLVLGERRFEELCTTVASPRLDAVCALLCRTSRAKAQEIIGQMRVHVNYAPCDNGAKTLSDGDIISVKGVGKAALSVGGQSKKGRWFITLHKYC